MIELVGDGVHLEPAARELVLEDPLGEVVALQEAIHVLIELSHEIRDTGLLVVVELEEPLAPFLPVEVLDLLKLLQVAKLVLEPPVPFPGHHPDMAPLVPEGLGTGILDTLLLAHTGTTKQNRLEDRQTVEL